MEVKPSFAPVVSSTTHTLILGSLPGDRSLAVMEYYGHPRNRFWSLIAALSGEVLPDAYTDKLAMLLRHGYGLWDIVQEAERKGSLDTAIKNERPNDIHLLLESYPTIERIAFNGKKAETLYYKHYSVLPSITYLSLPSTSPANAVYNFDRLIREWEKLHY